MARPPRDLPFWGLAVAAPIAAGAGIYILWRPRTLRVFGWLGAMGLDGPVRAARSAAAPLGQSLPGWVLYSLPDGLWALALSAAMARIWRGALRGAGAWAWVASGLAIGVGGEALQLVGALPGTPDIVDAKTSLVGAGLGVWWGLGPRGWAAGQSEDGTPASPLG